MNSIAIADKSCPRCKRQLSSTAFPKRLHTNNLDGLDSWCKGCNREAKRLQSRKIPRDAAYLKYHSLAQQKYRRQNTIKTNAQAKANYHKAELLKPQCEHCDSVDSLHMHHPDYSKPLEVITLCVNCHEIEHHGGVL